MTNYEKWRSKDSETSQMAATDGLRGMMATSRWRLPELAEGSQPHVSLEEGDSGHSAVAATQAGRCICMLAQSSVWTNFSERRPVFPQIHFLIHIITITSEVPVS